ncbi:NADPH--cytochrome P450 reductase-like protein [Exophiala viscosa]|uniref:Bifunctional cytochrome P450/NADPH--P450 reductase n=1 Tax=Exophiala viscosa TaxID=2486360 RepID=A0AAN6DVS7_9EURO|nr:NADPH--cytochrome P450 reductase-like protein [Exophiala viscosa]
MTEKIPGPRGLPIIGNLIDLWDGEGSILRSLERVADIYGPIYQASVGPGPRRIICSSESLLEELTDARRFVKVPPVIANDGDAKGLFTAPNEDPDWAQGHRILMPAFAPLSVQEMFTDMKDIANQLILSWARKGPENRICVTDDFTKLTLDTIALCTMNYRFNSFYTEAMNPFVEAMLVVLKENNVKNSRPGFVNKLMFRKEAERQKGLAFMKKVGMDIVENRRADPVEKKDFLNTLIYGKDPKTGEVMRDDLITAQMTTFLIAGHETTSGLLSFAMAHLLKNAHTYLKAQKEVDDVIGTRAIEVEDINKLKYLNAVFRETARLSPTVPVLQKKVNPEIAHNVVTVDGGRYKIESDDQVVILLGKAQRDPKVWGETAADFDPDRMSDENFDKIMSEHPGCWKPFGNGKRACIGRPFAWQESMLVIAMVLQNFDVKLDDPKYILKIKQNLTIKPDDLYVRVTPRKNMDATTVDRIIHNKTRMGGTNGVTKATELYGDIPRPGSSSSTTKPMTILYGSNTGTCQAFAQRLASNAASHGFQASVMDMDGATDSMPKGSPVVVITSSYEGQPPDNAARFIEWLQGCKEVSLSGVEYTVFGCGHRDWSQTFHRTPKLTDSLLAKYGARRIAPAGYTDAAKGNLYGDFEDWLDTSLWPNVSGQASDDSQPTIQMDVEVSTNARASSLRYDVSIGKVTENRVLTGAGEPTKCHMEIELRSDLTYECGDYLAVLPLNSEKSVKRVMAHFGLPWDAVVTVKATGPSIIPRNVPLSAFDVLRSYVELSQPATKKNLRTLAMYTAENTDKTYLEGLADDDTRFETEILSKRTSPFDLLVKHASVNLPFGEFLGLLPPLHVRQYSISSSPLADANKCSITYGVIETPALSDPERRQRFEGVCGSYLRSLTKGDSIQVSVRPSAKKSFRLPLDAESTPLLMFAAGTGIAPFRGFLQSRDVQMRANPGRKLARAQLFVGCRSKTEDRLYGGEIDEWVRRGVVDVRYAFSRDSEESEGCKYVSERMVRDARDVVEVWRGGARVYVCGTGRFRDGVREAAVKIAEMVAEKEGGREGSDEEKAEVQRRFTAMLEERVASDVFD